MAKANQCSPDKINKAFNYIEQEAKSINLLLEDILTMARTGSSVINFQPTSVDIVDFCQDLIETLQFSSGEKISVSI